MLKEEIINIKDEYVYEVKGRGIIIKDYIGKEKQITIPDTIDDKPVTKIASEAFEGKNLLEVNMPDTIKEVGKYAFASNMYMTNIKLSASLKSIPEGMLAFCGKLKELDVPPSVKSIGKNSFDYVKLRKIIIPASVQKISNKIFGTKLEENKFTTFIVEKESFAEQFLSSKDLNIEYKESL
ncbi:MAG: leucine-rich repeat domain-containing protein [Terrisporobacter sp.]|uniref:leucine-rich repeat domain-containing protein n=1 Tax=Terrisporobacter sp. TaxID=1965305 RepID=UPI002A81D031|nr:leucine-rich repeat domain-containing protein [Terrisporobacter sp.]MCI6457323.1 leucine-rich repeat domain-containing protein [Clostridium sp.]MDY4735223.1 leucine-rich repeat domain-containing protein [Terrisporobacter sp.]MDY6153956.1 leucine-rich repeat domain-containing protein [Terrisporobacter sp.]